MKGKDHSPYALDRFLHEVGIPTELMTDGAKELIHGDWSKLCRKHIILKRILNPIAHGKIMLNLWVELLSVSYAV